MADFRRSKTDCLRCRSYKAAGDPVRRSNQVACLRLADLPDRWMRHHPVAHAPSCGIDVADTYMAFDVAKTLKDDRGWTRVDVGSQAPGAIGTTCGQAPMDGTDRIYFVLKNLNAEEMVIADNGIGRWGYDTTSATTPMCALPPEDWKAKSGTGTTARGAKMSVAYKGKTIIGELRDTMPAKAEITNGAGIDLNPGFCAAFWLESRLPDARLRVGMGTNDRRRLNLPRSYRS